MKIVIIDDKEQDTKLFLYSDQKTSECMEAVLQAMQSDVKVVHREMIYK